MEGTHLSDERDDKEAVSQLREYLVTFISTVQADAAQDMRNNTPSITISMWARTP